jgi:hypothetical protein
MCKIKCTFFSHLGKKKRIPVFDTLLYCSVHLSPSVQYLIFLRRCLLQGMLARLKRLLTVMQD